MAAFPDGSRTRVAYIAESAWGTTPSTPTFKVMRVVSTGLRGQKRVGQSNELRADRNLTDTFVVGKSAGGSVEAELPYGSHDDLLQALLGGTWSTNVLVNASTRRSFTVEETIQLDGADSFARFVGMMVDTMDLRLEPEDTAKVSFGFMGKRETHAGSAISGATYTAPNTNRLPAATGSIAGLDLDGLSSSGVKVRSLSLSVKNNLRLRPVVDDYFTQEMGMGRFEVTGEATVYFTDRAIYEAVENHDKGSLEFVIGEVTNQKYRFTLPAIIFGDGERIGRTNGQDVMVRIPFTAVYDSGIAGTMKIERAIA